MRVSQMKKRLQILSAKIRPNGNREFTLEELCRQYWRSDQRGFRALANRDGTILGVFLSMFEREDAESALRQQRGACAR
jgi:hypothetical protein